MVCCTTYTRSDSDTGGLVLQGRCAGGLGGPMVATRHPMIDFPPSVPSCIGAHAFAFQRSPGTVGAACTLPRWFGASLYYAVLVPLSHTPLA